MNKVGASSDLRLEIFYGLKWVQRRTFQKHSKEEYVCVCVRVKVLVTWSSLFPKHPLTLKQGMFYMIVLYIQGFSFYSGSLQQMRTWNNERQE